MSQCMASVVKNILNAKIKVLKKNFPVTKKEAKILKKYDGKKVYSYLNQEGAKPSCLIYHFKKKHTILE